MKRFILLLTIITSLFAISCTSERLENTQSLNNEVQLSAQIASIDRYGNVTLNITTKELYSNGFNYGDHLLLVADNGYMTTAIISTEYTLEEGSTILKTGVNSQPVTACINYGNMAEEGSLTLGDSIELKLIDASTIKS
ncbi:MAG: hypothetical protein M0P10_02980 [Sphaerochaetaceae bacterium]|jgi:S-adenosylmethionine hydrolase|nr:hypothetical protein [Sphaerochaetaceae bacterium]